MNGENKMFVTIVIVIICASFAYLIIYGSSKNKSDEERKYEDEEQSKYLKDALKLIKYPKEFFYFLKVVIFHSLNLQDSKRC